MPKYIWLIPDGQLRFLWKPFIRYLADKTGYKILMIILTEQDRRFFERQFDQNFDAVYEIMPDLYDIVLKPEHKTPASSTIARSVEIEQEYDINMMRDLLLAHRHLGRGFCPGGSGHPRSPISEKSDWQDRLRACNESFDFVEELFEKYPPALGIGYYGGGGLRGKPLSVIFRKHGIPFRHLASGRVGDAYYWASNEFEESPGLAAYVDQYPAVDEAALQQVREALRPNSWATATSILSHFRDSLRWPFLLKAIFKRGLKRTYGRLRGYKKIKRTYYFIEEIRQMVNTRLHWDVLGRMCDPDLNRAEGRKIVYFPLQVEPEETIVVHSPERSDTFAYLMDVALSLPANAVLVIKEHFWEIGRRPRGYYRALKDIPNAIVIHPNFSSMEIIDHASLVCTITSSAAQEAAILGKQVLRFGQHGPLHRVAHVHDDVEDEVCVLVPRLLADDSAESARHRELEGARYFLALNEFCMDLGPFEMQGRTKPPSESEMKLLSDALLESLPEDWKCAVVGPQMQTVG